MCCFSRISRQARFKRSHLGSCWPLQYRRLMTIRSPTHLQEATILDLKRSIFLRANVSYWSKEACMQTQFNGTTREAESTFIDRR